MSKDAETEHAFERAEKDMERVKGSPFTVPVPIWEDPEPCPDCGSDQVIKVLTGVPGMPDRGWCLDCGEQWFLDTGDGE